ncbi:AtaL-like protein [Flavobacterium sp.]|uniref:AtaL-like protein n=1 Tax=Flavobacterium sp. TaxID=239 RepID=UPI003751D52F
MIHYTTTVNASLEKVWQHLILKIEKPENFVPGVSDVIILEKNEDFVTRKMTITTAENTTTLVEKITFLPYKVRFLLLEHPKFEGYVDNDIKAISDNETEMTFTINWKDKNTQSEFENQEMVKNAVLKTKTFIENN